MREVLASNLCLFENFFGKTGFCSLSGIRKVKAITLTGGLPGFRR